MHWRSKLIHPENRASQDFNSLATPVFRGSTVVFEKSTDIVDSWKQKKHGYTYGLFGGPTVTELGQRIADLENAFHCFLVPGGQAAIALVYLTFCKSGSHCLVPFNAYGPSKELAGSLLKKMGIEIETYDPEIGVGIEKLIRPNTSLIWTESPGSITLEIQDIPAITQIAKAHQIPVALDNTYSAGVLFDAFSFGVDVSVQALTKYISGHSDVVLGSVSVANEALYEKIGATWAVLGMNVSPDDASLALRGMQTLGVRLEKLERSTLQVSSWIRERPEVDFVLNPALSGCRGHEIWKRDFTGSASLFSFVFKESIAIEQVSQFVDHLKLFKLGFSWGGTTSLAMIYPGLNRPNQKYNDRLVRLNIGLEEPKDLIEDLEQAFIFIHKNRF